MDERTRKNRDLRENSQAADPDVDLHTQAILEELGCGDVQAISEDSAEKRDGNDDVPRLTRFRNWLARLTGDGPSSLKDPGSPLEMIANAVPKTSHESQSDVTGKKAAFPPLDTDAIVNDLLEVFDEPDKIVNVLFGLYQELSKRKDEAPAQFLIEIARISGSLYDVLRDRSEVSKILELVAQDGGQEKASQRIFAGGLPAICIYELLRQSAGKVLKSEAKVTRAKKMLKNFPLIPFRSTLLLPIPAWKRSVFIKPPLPHSRMSSRKEWLPGRIDWEISARAALKTGKARSGNAFVHGYFLRWVPGRPVSLNFNGNPCASRLMSSTVKPGPGRFGGCL